MAQGKAGDRRELDRNAFYTFFRHATTQSDAHVLVNIHCYEWYEIQDDPIVRHSLGKRTIVGGYTFAGMKL